MQILTNPQELAAQCRAWHAQGEDIALVPTMGYYHAGHEDLMVHARGLAKRLVVSLFVNPRAVRPRRGSGSLPPRCRARRRHCRKPRRGRALHARAGFHVRAGPRHLGGGAGTGESLCGQSRPIHFRGVCTVVLKLFMLTRADVAVFGQKDWQQQAIIRRMVRDLNVPTRIEARPTVREADGLALSSRNVYMTAAERAQAPEIRAALLYAQKLTQEGETSAALLREAVLRRWAERLPLGRLDYLSIVHPESMAQLNEVNGPALMACAVRMGKARLIDNILLRS